MKYEIAGVPNLSTQTLFRQGFSANKTIYVIEKTCCTWTQQVYFDVAENVPLHLEYFEYISYKMLSINPPEFLIYFEATTELLCNSWSVS